MAEKYNLNLIIAAVILVISLALAWAFRIWDSMAEQLFEGVADLLFGGAIAFFIWTLLKKGKTMGLLEFFVRGLVVSFVVTSIISFVRTAIVSPLFYTYLGLWSVTFTLTNVVPPLSLLALAISVIIYGMFRARLKPWIILLSGWYTAIFVVSSAYTVWWFLFVQPYLEYPPYSSGAGAIALDMLLTVLAFFAAGAFTLVYQATQESKEQPPP